jgi:hypothetical protein
MRCMHQDQLRLTHFKWLLTYTKHDRLWRKFIRLLLQLTLKSAKLPEMFFIHGVDIGNNRDPVASGGFADVFRGQYRGQTVAIKRLRIASEEHATVHPVRFYAHF